MDDDASEPAHTESKDRNFVTALARGLDLLRCFRAGDVMLTNRDFAERTDLPKATISRLTHTLCALDYLVLDPRSGGYRLSAGVLHLGYGVLTAMDVNDRVEPELRALRDGPNSYITAAFAEPHGLDAVYLAVQTSRQEVSLLMRVGSRLPMFHSAVGRALLVGMTSEEREHILLRARQEGPACEEQGHEAIKDALAEYQSKGFCTGYGTWREDVNGIAMPVMSLSGSRAYALNVGGPAYHISKQELEEVYAERLKQTAQRLGQA